MLLHVHTVLSTLHGGIFWTDGVGMVIYLGLCPRVDISVCHNLTKQYTELISVVGNITSSYAVKCMA